MKHDYKVVGWSFATREDREERDRQIDEMREKRMTTVQIADHFGMTERSIAKAIARSKYARGDAYCIPELIARNEEIKRMRLEGRGLIEIGVLIGVHESAVRDVLAKMGVTYRPPHPLRDAMRALIEQGLGDRQIAEKLKVHPRTVGRVRAGLEVFEARPPHAEKVEILEDGPYPLDYPIRPARLVPTVFVDRFFNVEPIDPVLLAYDEKPFMGGRYPKTPCVAMSGHGSPAQLCAMYG